jgi:uncharacterized protein with PIN domain
MKFLLTRELGKLAKWLRILGFNAEYFSEDNAASLIVQALRDDRVILSRNHRLPQGRGVRIVLVNSDTLKLQILQVLRDLKLPLDEKAVFTRCVLCNMELSIARKEDIKESVPRYVFDTQDNFTLCPKCKRVYWAGTHWGNVKQILDEVNR